MNCPYVRNQDATREVSMTFEEAGRNVDRELKKLKKWLDRKAEPSARQEMADGLRKIAERLAELADRLDAPER